MENTKNDTLSSIIERRLKAAVTKLEVDRVIGRLDAMRILKHLDSSKLAYRLTGITGIRKREDPLEVSTIGILRTPRGVFITDTIYSAVDKDGKDVFTILTYASNSKYRLQYETKAFSLYEIISIEQVSLKE